MVRLAVIGSGRWGPNYIRNFSEMEGVEVVGVADASEAALAQVIKRFPHVTTTTDYRQLVQRDDVDALVVATPAVTHREIGLTGLQAGKHVLMEKPLASSAAEARELAQSPLAAGQVLMVGHIFRFHPAVIKLHEVLAEGVLGDIRYIHCLRTNLGPVRRDVSVIWDLAPHDVSIALHLLGAVPVRVSATLGRYLQESSGDVAFMTLTFPGGELVNIHVSWVDPQKRREVEVIGTNALARFDDMNLAEPVRIVQRSLKEMPSYATFGEFQLVTHISEGIIPAVEAKEPLKEQCLEFIRSIEQGKQQSDNVREGYQTCAILEAAEQSAARDGAPVEIVIED
jgi:predicted dehydrogenase